MPLVVRTWNVFHGNALPPRRRGFLREMIELICDDSPDVVCLQEVPVWGIARLEEWSSMQALAVVARSPRVPGRAGVRVTRWNQGFFRSAFVGQANAVLVARSLTAEDRGHLQISDSGRERRVVQAVGVGGSYVIANLHANRGREVAESELKRARAFAEAASRVDEIVVLAGDFNLRDFQLDGYSASAAGIDHILLQGASVSAPLVWPTERRERDGAVLSDHAPVEVTIW
ncbi:MAG: endonuclease/exonuclease/phosphatase family protein [Actinobacteria bacterium]|nr:endonuclease/exonuclease/phosphatase family protein [Actinomycetota bacterium]MBA3567298.1 endonuclease/exonuclease/phosphatase family protein [Actinomycetota bacterium]MDQ3424627.1 endonuclease/exonuclease/phosphatase family protein [Actinomycetota bacterium]